MSEGECAPREKCQVVGECLQHLATACLELEAECTDAVLVAMEGTRDVALGANKLSLAAESEVFEAMFFKSGLRMKKDTHKLANGRVVECVRIADCSKAATEAIIRESFQCLDVETLAIETISELLYAAEKYVIDSIKRKCSERLSDLMREGSCQQLAVILNALHSFPVEHYFCECFEQLQTETDNFCSLFLSDACLQLPLALFKQFLASKSLEIDEAKIWLRCVEWAEENVGCVARACDEKTDGDDFEEVLLELSQMVDFELMPLHFFLETVAPMKVLSFNQHLVTLNSIKRASRKPRLWFADGYDTDVFQVTHRQLCRRPHVEIAFKKLPPGYSGITAMPQLRTGVHEFTVRCSRGVDIGFAHNCQRNAFVGCSETCLIKFDVKFNTSTGELTRFDEMQRCHCIAAKMADYSKHNEINLILDFQCADLCVMSGDNAVHTSIDPLCDSHPGTYGLTLMLVTASHTCAVGSKFKIYL